ncbi:glycosyltransferase family 2 protein [Sphaerospermopsis aphanizomenoides BCCUSP55]|uniref:glycosyltransferase family 2 protein n=1 Tax=Sphaerospermopsis aphanizomenoides TaxID=459663 RepID=UPI000A58A097|nr:glycosyltransferase family 2 protein [Sphaerospermopsis aphanizomenoides]MBK1986812.1 glycosyltransferase family 2 protein [Sphaerospermopsis aphanizomenoides BCCUSP55]
MYTSQPKLSIGMPVYNGEKFLQESLDSLLNQTFGDFELIISDNASTDNTEEICRNYAAQDQRIRYYRNASNIGCARNFHRVLELSKSEYFKWAAYDDLHAPDFLSKCIQLLEENSNYILCHSQTYFIDEHGEFLQNYDIKLNTNSAKPQVRFEELLTKHLCYQMYGVIRQSALKKIPPMGGYGNADGILLLRLGLIGQFYEIPEYLFFARSHPQQSLSMFFPNYLSFNHNNPQYSLDMLPNFYEYSVWFDSSNNGKLLFPHWRILKEYLISLSQSSLNWYEQILCYWSIVKKLSGTESLLIKDLFMAVKIWRSQQKLVSHKSKKYPALSN